MEYFLEGQAVFIQSVLCSEKEMESPLRYYPIQANKYLDLLLNTSLKRQSYNFCLYWRYLYEKFNTNQNLSEREKLAIIRDCYIQTDSVGDNPISDGAKAIDQAFLKANQNQPRKFSTFAQSIDSFATACYLKDFNPNNVYVEPLENLIKLNS